MDIKVLGTGCANCKTTLKLIEEVAAEKGVAVTVAKVEDIRSIMSYGVMSTPGVVIDGKVVHAGGVPSRDKIAAWLAGLGAAPVAAKTGGCCCGGGGCA
jgi:small redox-active disulfide protein 2